MKLIFSLKEKFNAHINLRNNVDFVKNFVDLFDLLIEYRDLKLDSSEELKTFYLNEILVKKNYNFNHAKVNSKVKFINFLDILWYFKTLRSLCKIC